MIMICPLFQRTIIMNKSLTPTKIKHSPLRNDTPNRSTSGKSPIKREPFSDQFVQEKLHKNRQKLTHTLDTYTMLIRSRNPIRCLEHNSIVSIFCETENKLLCTNCVFGKNQHKFHKISPMDKCYDRIRQSIDRMTISVDKQVKVISNIKEVILNNLEGEESDMHKNLNLLSVCHSEAEQLLNDYIFMAKQKLIRMMEQIRLRHETVALELNFLKDIYSVGVPVEINALQCDAPQLLLYHHSILHTINSQRKFEGNVWNTNRNEIQKAGEEQVKRISQISELLKRYMSAHNQPQNK